MASTGENFLDRRLSISAFQSSCAPLTRISLLKEIALGMNTVQVLDVRKTQWANATIWPVNAWTALLQNCLQMANLANKVANKYAFLAWGEVARTTANATTCSVKTFA